MFPKHVVLPQTTEVPGKYTIMEPTHKDMPPPHMYNALQLLFLSKPYKNTEDYVDAFSL